MDEGYDGDTLTPDHLERLRWFDERAGQVVPWPEPLPGKRHPATRAKGIYKPDGWDYALSVKILPGSKYDDGEPVETPGGGWLLSYHQEGSNPDFYTNAALKRCIQNRIPVGVIQKVDTRRRQVEYEVLGLALPVRWYGEHFILESVNPPATTLVDPLTDVLIANSEAGLGHDIDDVPADDYDARRRTQRQITQRRGQAPFRAALIRAYGGRCAITRCDAVDALEHAHTGVSRARVQRSQQRPSATLGHPYLVRSGPDRDRPIHAGNSIVPPSIRHSVRVSSWRHVA
jgi:putative restriction endonuclease